MVPKESMRVPKGEIGPLKQLEAEIEVAKAGPLKKRKNRNAGLKGREWRLGKEDSDHYSWR